MVSRLVWGECCFAKKHPSPIFKNAPVGLLLKKKKKKTIPSEFTCLERVLLFFRPPPLPPIPVKSTFQFPRRKTSSPLPISFATFHLGGALNYEHHLNLVFTATRIHLLSPSSYRTFSPLPFLISSV